MKTHRLQGLKAAALASLFVAIGASANAQLLHRYDFNTTNDTVGTANGVLRGSATISGGGLVTTGGVGGLSGGLPQNSMMLPGSAVAGITNAFTIETWYAANFNGGYCTLFSFSGNNINNYVLGTPARGANPYQSSVEFVGGGGSASYQLANQIYCDNGTLHQMVVTYDGTNVTYYLDGTLPTFAGLQNTFVDVGMVLSNLTYIGINGGSPYADNTVKGTNFDFRIYGQALTPIQVGSIFGLGKDASNASISSALVPPTAFVWNGAGANDNWGTGLNWVGGTAPATSGTSLTFAGSTRPTPNLNANYNVIGLTFSNTASAFAIGTTTSSTLTLAGDVINNSASTETFNVPVSIGGAVALNTTGGSLVLNSNIALGVSLTMTGNNNLTLNGNVAGSGTFTKNGAGTLTMAGSSFSAGAVSFNNGTTLLSGAVSAATGTTYIGYLTNNAVVNLSGGTFNNGGEIRVGGSDQNGATINGSGTFTMSGGTANLNALTVARGNYLDNSVSGTVTLNSGSTLVSTNDVILQFAGSGLGKIALNGGNFIVGPTALKWFMIGYYDSGAGELDITNGNLFLDNSSCIRMCRNGNTGANAVNQFGGAVTFYSDAGVTAGGTGVLDLNYAGGGASTSTYNLNGGTLTVPQIIASSVNGSSTFNFNGGTLKPTAATATFMQGLSGAYVMPGGAIVDTVGNNITIAQPLLDGGGGLTKLGAGTLALSGGYNYSGPTFVRGGTLSLDAAQTSSAASVVTVTNATLALSLNNGASTISVASVIFNGNSALNLNFGTATAPSAAAISASTVTVTGTNVINITGQLLVVGQYPLIYTGSSVPTNNFKLGPLPTGMSAKLVNSGASLDLLVTAAGQTLTWYGADSLGNPLTDWNINTSSNWNTGNAKYLQYSGNSYGDNVIFDDTVYPGNTSINLSARVVPSTVLFNSSSQAYSVTGTGGIDGVVSLVVTNAGSLVLGTSNNYSGGTFVGGTLIISNNNALGNVSSGVSLTGGTLQLNGAVTSARSVTLTANSTIGVVSGVAASLSGPISGSGTLINADNGALTLSGSVTSAGFTMSGSGLLTLGGNVTSSGLVNLTSGTNVVSGTMTSGNSETWVGADANSALLNLQSGSSVTASNWLVVGRNGGSGTININGGKLVHAGGGNLTVGTLGTEPVGTINLNSGSISNLTGETYLGEGSSAVNYGNYNQAGGNASLGNFYVGHGAGGGQGIGTALVTGGTLTANNLEIGFGNNNTRIGTNIMTIGAGATVNATGFVRLGFAGSATLYGMLTNNGGILNVGSTALYLGYYDPCSGVVALNSGQINLQNSASVILGSQFNNSGVCAFNQNGGTVTFYSDAGTTVGGSGSLTLGDAGLGNYTYNLSGGTLTVPQIQESTGTGTFNFSGGTLKAAASNPTFMQGLTAAQVMTLGAIIDTAGNNITIAQALLDGDGLGGGLTKNGNGTLTLDGVNTYTGRTVVNAGTLAGAGTIAGALTNSATLAPGDGGTGALTVSGNLTLKAGSTNVFAVSGTTPTNSSVIAGSSVAYGGVLKINASGSFTTGQQFVLFSGAGATNTSNFASIQTTGSSVTFSFTNGILTASSSLASNPTNISFTVSGSTLSLSWPADHLGWILQSQTNSLSTGLGTNWVDVPGSDSVTSTNITISPAKPTAFYRLRHP